MLAAAVGLTAVRGDSLVLQFLVTDEAGAVANITGTTPRLAVERWSDPDDRLQVEGTVTDAEGGLFRVTLTREQTQALAGLYAYQAVLDDLSDNRQTVSRGTIHFVEPWVAG